MIGKMGTISVPPMSKKIHIKAICRYNNPTYNNHWLNIKPGENSLPSDECID